MTVPHSGDRPGIPSRDRRFFGLVARGLPPRESTGRFVLLAALFALLPLLLATIAFGRAFRSSETARADARLVTATRLARDRVAAADTLATSAAKTLAGSRELQTALASNDRAALERLAYTRGVLAVTVAQPGDPVPSPRGTLVRTASVVSGNMLLGRVDAVVRIAPLLASAAATTHTQIAIAGGGVVLAGPMRTWRVSGPVGQVARVSFHGERYRVVRSPVASGLGIVAVEPESEIAASVRHRQLVTIGAGELTVVALVLAGLLLLPRGRGLLRGLGSPRRHRSPVALVGDVVAAAHDPRALLPVILETAVAALNAAGGSVVWDGERIASLGTETTTGGRLVLPLDDDEEASRRRQIVLYPPRGGFSASDRDVARSLVAQGRIALDNARLHSVVRRQAVTDELTDLANRRRFMEVLQHEVARAARFDSSLALVLFDLDHFKQINDRYGHQRGDDVLRSTAEVIRRRVRETDLPARIGGEEFAVILTGTGGEGAAALAEHLRRDLSQHVTVPGGKWTVTASFGVAVLRPGDSAELLIGAADRALYRAKAEGRNKVASAEAEPSPTGWEPGSTYPS